MSDPDTDRRERAEMEPLLSVDSVASLLGISERGVYRLISRGELVSLKIGGRTRIQPADLRTFIAAQRQIVDSEVGEERAA